LLVRNKIAKKRYTCHVGPPAKSPTEAVLRPYPFGPAHPQRSCSYSGRSHSTSTSTSSGTFINSSSHSLDFTIRQGFEEDVANLFVLKSSLLNQSPGFNTLLGSLDHIQHGLRSRFLPLFCAADLDRLVFGALFLPGAREEVSFWICLDIFTSSLLIFTSSFWIFIQASCKWNSCAMTCRCCLWKTVSLLSVSLCFLGRPCSNCKRK
jgi:hypothetical protein